MKTKIAFLTVLMVVWTLANWASSDSDEHNLRARGAGVGAGAGAFTTAGFTGDDLGREKEILTRRIILENQRDAIERMGLIDLFSGLSMRVGDAISILGDMEGQPYSDFLATLHGCVDTGTNQDMTLNELLKEKNDSLSSAKALTTTDSLLRVPTRPAGAPVSAAASAFSQEEIFSADYRLRPELGDHLPGYLSAANLLDFFHAQVPLPIQYGVEFIENDRRLPGILGMAGREYKKDKEYLWLNLIEIISERFEQPISDDGINRFLHMLKYHDTWAIGKAISNHNKFYKTHDIVRWLRMTPEERAAASCRVS